MIKATNALNQSSFFSYSDSELVKITDSLNHDITMTHDAIGRMLSVIDPSGHAYKIAYDALGRATQNQNPMGQSTQYAYDAGGNRTQVINALGNIHRFGFDSRNNITAETNPLGQSETYQYDANRNLIKKTDRKGQATQYAYDALNRLTRITYADHSSVTFTYDGGNRVTQIADSQNGTITNTWDNFDRLTQQTTAQGTVNYTYYPNGLRKTMSATGQPTLTYTYDNANRLTRIDQAAGTLNNNQAQYISFTYDAANKRTQTRLANGQTVNYAYDAAGQLTNITYKNADGTEIGNLTYAYDPSGQRISVGGSLARTDLPEDNQSTTDAANRLTGFNNQALTYDANGNLTGDGINTYTWNARNQLIQMTGAVNAGFTYDATGRRKSKTVNGQTTSYLYDGDNILQEQAVASLKAGYLMGGIDEIFTRQTPSQTYNYLTDALGSVIRLTDNTGNKLVDYTYDPYGNTAADAVIDNPFQYTGRENDQTGLYYYRARYYSPTYQRFISEDPIGLSGGINVYAYVEGDPILFNDPFGLIPSPICPDPTKCPKPPYDPTPDGPKPSPQPRAPKSPKSPQDPEFCASTQPTFGTCMDCCTKRARNVAGAATQRPCQEKCSSRVPPYPDAPYQTCGPSNPKV